MAFYWHPNDTSGIPVARQAAIGEPETEEYVDAETATINALNAKCGDLGVSVGGPPGRIAGFNLVGTTAEDLLLNNVRAIALIWTDDDRSGGAPATSVDEGTIADVCAAFPANT